MIGFLVLIAFAVVVYFLLPRKTESFRDRYRRRRKTRSVPGTPEPPIDPNFRFDEPDDLDPANPIKPI